WRRGSERPAINLSNQLVTEGIAHIPPAALLGDEVGLQRRIERIEQVLILRVSDFLEHSQAESRADHRGGGQHGTARLRQTLETPADDEANSFRDVEIFDAKVRPPFSARVEQPAFFLEVSEHLLDEERVSVRLLINDAGQRGTRL